MKLRLDLRLSQKLIMTPQLQQAIKLLQLSRLELQQTLRQHLDENPLLDEVQLEAEEAEEAAADEYESEPKKEEAAEPSEEEKENQENQEEMSALNWDDYGEPDRRADVEYPSGNQDEFPSYEQTVAKPTSLEDYLVWQLGLSALSDHEKHIARIIIGNLDDDGYLQASVEEIAADAGVTVDEARPLLRHVQTLDPPGVGARDLTECLLIQLGYLDGDPIGRSRSKAYSLRGSLVEAIVLNHLKDLEKKQYQKIAKTCNVEVDDVFRAAHVIEQLEPKPGRPFYSQMNHAIIPDVYVAKDEGEWVVMLNDDGLPRMRITPYYKQMMASDKGGSQETKDYLDEKLRAAQWVIKSIEQRNKTIVKVVTSIVKFQEQFFDKGVHYLKPLVLKQVAEDIGMHESTISRVTANKYLYCPQGMFELKFFFNTGIQRSDHTAEMLSSVTVKEMIKNMVAEEDARNPLKDEEIAARLKSHQILIARRTVAKYRSEENIPSASQRRRFF